MTRRLPPAAFVAALGAVLLARMPASRADAALSICLDKSNAAAPAEAGHAAGGFDLAVAQALARRLGRAPIIVWYESERDSDSNPAGQINALLSDGRCQLVAGYPLFAFSLGAPRAPRSRLPDYSGAKPGDRRRWVSLNALAGSAGYRYDPMVVVLGRGAAGRRVHTLAELGGMKLAVEEGTLADAVLMAHDGGKLIPGITHMSSDREVFSGLERGDYDATLVELHRLDAYLSRHPGSGLSSSGHYHSVGFNIGIVGLASDPALMAGVNAAIGDMLAAQELPDLARSAKVTYLPPREPNVASAIAPAVLRGD